MSDELLELARVRGNWRGCHMGACLRRESCQFTPCRVIDLSGCVKRPARASHLRMEVE